MNITNGKRTLEVSEKAFRIFYKEQGYKEVENKPRRSTKKVEQDDA